MSRVLEIGKFYKTKAGFIVKIENEIEPFHFAKQQFPEDKVVYKTNINSDYRYNGEFINLWSGSDGLYDIVEEVPDPYIFHERVFLTWINIDLFVFDKENTNTILVFGYDVDDRDKLQKIWTLRDVSMIWDHRENYEILKWETTESVHDDPICIVPFMFMEVVEPVNTW